MIPISRGGAGVSISQRRENSIQMLYSMQFFQIRGRGICPYSFQNFRGKLSIWGNPPSVALDTTMIKDVRVRTTTARLYWKYIYLKARNISDIMHWYDRNPQLISIKSSVIPCFSYTIAQFIIRLWQQRFFLLILLKPFGVAWEEKIWILFQI